MEDVPPTCMRYLIPDRFQAIVRHARRTNPFYARWIPEGGPVPVLTRRVLQDHNDEILNGLKATACTSGSTGMPVRVHMPRERVLDGLRDIAGFIRHMGRPLPRTDIMRARSAHPPPEFLAIFTPIPEQLEVLRRNFRERGATAIITYPSNAGLLAQEILATGSDFGFIRRVGMISETVDPGVVETVKRAFPNARIWSSYSCMEVGLISFQCPYEPEFHHVVTRKLALEILDESGKACGLGQPGRVVLTDYLNRKMPIIRYEIGDLAEFASCPCGRLPAPALRNIVGKIRGCLVHRDGRRVPFMALSVSLRNLPGMRQFQVIQEELERFTVKVVADGPIDDGVRAEFEREFGYLPRIGIERVDAIPREPSGKFYASICRIGTAERADVPA